MNQKTIQIVLSTDPDYVIPTYITIYSLLKNHKGNRPIRIHILVPGNPNYSYDIFSHLQKEFKNMSLEIIQASNCFDNVSFIHRHIKVPTMYRLLIPDLLLDIEKCIYLDSDLVVERDITELFDSDIEKCFVAGVREYAIEDAPKYLPKIPDKYVNAGVLLMNLDRIRREEKATILVKVGQSNNFLYNDQDAINVVFDGGVELIPPKYNHNRGLWIKDIRYPLGDYDRKELLEARKRPIIVHYTGHMKPWNCRYCPTKKRWMRYINMQSKEFREEFVTPFLEINRNKEEFSLTSAALYRLGTLLARINLYDFTVEKYRWIRARLWRRKSNGERA